MIETLQIEDLSAVRIDPTKLEAARKVADDGRELTREQVAAECGVTYTAIYNVEKGLNHPSAELLAKLCVLYNKDVRELLAGAA